MDSAEVAALTLGHKQSLEVLRLRLKIYPRYVLSSHGKCHDHREQRDFGKYLALSIRCFVVNQFLSEFYVLFGEHYYFQQTQCSRGCSTYSLVINSLTQ